MTEAVASVVIGAGVIGCAIARAISQTGRAGLLLEQNNSIASETSARNSEVLHAGLYYPPTSLKAKLCVAGRTALVTYAKAHHIPHNICGKLIISRSGEEALYPLLENARKSGVTGLKILNPKDVRALEPDLPTAAAIHSPGTGIICAHSLSQQLLADAENAGTILALGTKVTRIARTNNQWAIYISDEDTPVVTAPLVINAAGLHAWRIAEQTEGLNKRHIPPQHLVKGSYFRYDGKAPFSQLIYPLPQPGGCGTHLTFDMGGAARFGPDIEPVSAIDYTVDPEKKADFVAAAQQIWPALDADRLHPDYAGMRPKTAPIDAPMADFQIDGPAVHGLNGMVNLFGIESPGLTSCLAIARHVDALCPT